MRLIYENNGRQVKEGDVVKTFRGDMCKIVRMVQPHKSSSTGLVYVEQNKFVSGFYPEVVGAVWID